MASLLGGMRRVASALRRRLSPPAIAPPAPADPRPRVDFRCNVCGHANHAVLRGLVENRETQTCAGCHSSLRMRSLMHALATELYGRAVDVPDFPADKSIRGLGMSDWDGYALRLARSFSYVNTYYHSEPRLDITNLPEAMVGGHRFLISSDVFEHIPIAGLETAFRNSRRLLQPGGSFIFSVPFVKEGPTREHFPRLHDFRIVEENGRRILRNRTLAGDEETFEDLVFHGGDGLTLEMRVFSQADLVAHLERAGFASVEVRVDHVPELGILWPIDFHVPIVARA